MEFQVGQKVKIINVSPQGFDERNGVKVGDITEITQIHSAGYRVNKLPQWKHAEPDCFMWKNQLEAYVQPVFWVGQKVRIVYVYPCDERVGIRVGDVSFVTYGHPLESWACVWLNPLPTWKANNYFYWDQLEPVVEQLGPAKPKFEVGDLVVWRRAGVVSIHEISRGRFWNGKCLCYGVDSLEGLSIPEQCLKPYFLGDSFTSPESTLAKDAPDTISGFWGKDELSLENQLSIAKWEIEKFRKANAKLYNHLSSVKRELSDLVSKI